MLLPLSVFPLNVQTNDVITIKLNWTAPYDLDLFAYRDGSNFLNNGAYFLRGFSSGLT